MHIKTFHAFTMQEALRAIKAELGADAVILSSKEVRREGPFARWVSRPIIEVTAAIERPPSRPATRTMPLPVKNDPIERPGKVAQPATAPAEFEETLRGMMRSAGPASHRITTPSPPPASDTARPQRQMNSRQLARIQAELRALYQHLVEAYPDDMMTVPKSIPGPVTSLYRDLVARGVSFQHASTLVLDIHAHLSGDQLVNRGLLHDRLRGILGGMLTVNQPLLSPGIPQKTVILVGPSGVGKTTTIAKLAAHYQMEQRRSVTLVTLDTHRVAAVEHLKMYAHTLDLPLEIVLTRREVRECLTRHREKDLILVDTGGRNSMDPSYIDEFRKVPAQDRPVETHLVLAATTREQDLSAATRQFSRCPVDRLLFTKLDEASGVGSLLTLHQQTCIPLSYFSVGPRVPDDIEPATPDRLTDMLLCGTLRPHVLPAETTERSLV